MSDDERGNLPSASGIERLFLCPGSFALERTQPPAPVSEDANSGTRIHEALAKFYQTNRDPEPTELSDHETETFDMCATVADRLVMAWINPDLPTAKHKLEQREWLLSDDLEVVMSGQYDVLLLEGRRGLVIDYKTGHGEQTESTGNLQLRALAVLVAAAETVDELTVAIIQPWVSMTPQMCVYGPDDLTAARTEILNILARAEDPHAPRVPGEKQCKFCRARNGACPEANGAVLQIATIQTREIPPADLAKMLETADVAEDVIKALRARAKYLLDRDPCAIPGWTLEEGNEKRKVAKPGPGFDALVQRLDTEEKRAQFREEFLANCVTVKVSEAEKIFRRISGLKTLPAKDVFNAALEAVGALEKNQNKPSLARVPLALEQAA